MSLVFPNFLFEKFFRVLTLPAYVLINQADFLAAACGLGVVGVHKLLGRG